MRCWLWTWWLWHIARLCVTSSCPLPIWPSTERGATVLEALVLEALCFPISSLCAVIGSSSLARHGRSLPIITSKARLTLNPNNPAEVILPLQEEAALTHIWNIIWSIRTRRMLLTEGYASLILFQTVLSPRLCSDAAAWFATPSNTAH